jgi:hypothetical protein
MDSFFDLYLGMANGFLDIFEILFLIFLFIIIKVKENKLNVELRIKFYNIIKMILFCFLAIIFLINLYLIYKMFDSKFYLNIPGPSMESVVTFFEGVKKKIYPFLWSQVVVSVICFVFYLWIYYKNKCSLKTLVSN